MTRRDWVLLALASAGEHKLQPVQLQKSLFLVSQKLEPEVLGEFYSFEPYDYGPFSRDVYDDAESLAAEGLVSTQPRPGVRWREYEATEAGLARTAVIRDEADGRAQEFLARAVEWTQRLSFPELIRAVYKHFPEFKAKSVFQDR